MRDQLFEWGKKAKPLAPQHSAVCLCVSVFKNAWVNSCESGRSQFDSKL